MPIYGALQGGGVLTALAPGESYALFDGSEAPAAGLKSIAYNRAPGALQVPSPQVFTVTFAALATATVLIQGSNDDVEAHYQTVGTLAFAGVVTPGYYADAGEFAYYRAVLSAYAGGGMPTVIVKR
jgi:hypothetical protein